LHSHIQKFTQQASEIAEWELKLCTNTTKVCQLYENLEVVEKAQNDLDDGLGRIDSQQREIDETISELEKKVESLFTGNENNAKLQPAEEQRENAYEMAENINAQLNMMDVTLNNLISTLNSQQQFEEEDSEIAKITEVLNIHYETLNQICQKSTALETKLNETEQTLDQQKRAAAQFQFRKF